MSIVIGNASQNESGQYAGGQRGDQTGKEVTFRTFTASQFKEYKSNKGWNILRPRSSEDAQKIVDAMVMACKNDNIGYSQNDRDSLYNSVKSKNFNPSYADKCNTDCSALVRVCLAYAGIKLGDFYTGDEAETLLSSGKFDLIKDSSITSDISKFKLGDVLVTKVKGHTMIVVSTDGTTPDSPKKKSGPDFELYKFNTYSLTNDQLIKITRLCKQEQGTVLGAQAEASLAANRYENFGDGVFHKKYKTIYDYMRNSGDFYRAAYYMDNGSYTEAFLTGVKSVLVDGHRTLPVFVDAHDSWGDIREVTTNGKRVPEGYKYKDQYIKDVTKIISYNDSRTWRSEYTFWTFPAVNSDPFGYESKSKREKYADSIKTAEYYAGGGEGDGGEGGGDEDEQEEQHKITYDYTQLRPYVLVVDRNTTKNYNYLDLKFNQGVSGVIIEAGYLYDENRKKVTFRNPKCYAQTEAARNANLPWGYIFKSTAKNVVQADAEIKELAYIVRKYPPYLGVWIDVNAKNSVNVNNTLIQQYEKLLVNLGLKDMIGLRVDDVSFKKFTWLNFQSSWYLWKVQSISNTSELDTLLDPRFFDTDGK